MRLYYNYKNDSDFRTMGSEYYLKVEDIQKSENTNSIYAYVTVYSSRYSSNEITAGWISLNSENFIVYD